MFCPSCGTQNPDGARFCAHCGTTFAPAAPTRPAPDQAAPAQETPAQFGARGTVSRLGVAGVVISALVVVALLALPWLSLADIPRTFVGELQPYAQQIQSYVSSASSYTDSLTLQPMQDAASALDGLKADYPTYEAGAFASQVAAILRAAGTTGIPTEVASSLQPIVSVLDGLSPVCAVVGVVALAAGALCLVANVVALLRGRNGTLRRLPLVGFAVVTLVCLAWAVAIGVANSQISSSLASAVTPSLLGAAAKGNPFTGSMTALANYAVSFPFFSLSLGTLVALVLSVAGVVVSALNLRRRA